MSDKLESQLSFSIQLIALFVALVGNFLNLFNKSEFINFFINKQIGYSAIIVILFFWVLGFSIITHYYVDFSKLLGSNTSLFKCLLFLVLLFLVYIIAPKLPIDKIIIDSIQFVFYVLFWSIVLIFLTNSIITYLRNLKFKESKRNFPQILLETIKKYSSIFTDKNLRILGSYNIQPQNFKGENPFINNNLFTVDNFLSDGEKYWWVKTDSEGLQIYFTKEIDYKKYENFVRSFEKEHPLIQEPSIKNE